MTQIRRAWKVLVAGSIRLNPLVRLARRTMSATCPVVASGRSSRARISARAMRRDVSFPERLLWSEIKASRLRARPLSTFADVVRQAPGFGPDELLRVHLDRDPSWGPRDLRRGE